MLQGPAQQPLADRLRPGRLDGFVGQAHLRERIGHLMASQRLPSLLLFGPPGCGKSTLALILAQSRGVPFVRVSAPEAGLAELRKRIKDRSLLILDELHRFSKAQQDFFLPLLESGEITLLATTTENPSFSVTRQLLSRLHVLRLAPLTDAELLEVGLQGRADLGLDEAELPEASLGLLAALAHGDARTLLNLVEYAAQLAPEDRQPEQVRHKLPSLVMRHDKQGDSHYELASAMIKSIRGSDVDAALYYAACLAEGGEDPRFITRRLMISAAEDVGLADPAALSLAVACHQCVEAIGMPEGFIPISECVAYLALAEKSNTAYAAGNAARQEVREHGPAPAPLHLRNAATKLAKEWGYGKGYLYPHNYPKAWVDQAYLPEALAGRRFYQDKDRGEEKRLVALWRQRRKG